MAAGIFRRSVRPRYACRCERASADEAQIKQKPGDDPALVFVARAVGELQPQSTGTPRPLSRERKATSRRVRGKPNWAVIATSKQSPYQSKEFHVGVSRNALRKYLTGDRQAGSLPTLCNA